MRKGNWLFLVLVITDLTSPAIDLYRLSSSSTKFLHVVIVLYCLLIFIIETLKLSNDKANEYRVGNFWLLTLTIPAVIGYIVMWVAREFGVVAGTDGQLVLDGILFGSFYFIPQVGAFLGRSFLKNAF